MALRGKTQWGAHSESVLETPALDYYTEEAVAKILEGHWKWQDRYTAEDEPGSAGWSGGRFAANAERAGGGAHIPIHRHLKSSETVVCLEGCFDEVFFDELPNMDAGGSVLNGEIALDETCFKEVARFRVCPREGIYGIQVPMMAWHTLEVHEPSTIFESKDGAYAPLGPEEVRG